MDATTIFAILALIGAALSIGNPLSDENKPKQGGKKSRRRMSKNNNKSRKY